MAGSLRRSFLKAGRTPPALLVILALFTTLTLYQSINLPLGEASDETDHYQYLRFVARTGHPPLTGAERDEAGFKGGLAPLYYWLAAWPVALVGESSLPDIRRVDARPERFIPTDGLGINHVLHTLDEGWPWRGQTLAWRLVRLLSLPMGLVTIVATYALARRMQPETPEVATGAALLVAFLPRFVISSAVINDDNLVFALTTLLLLVQVIIWQGSAPPSPRLMALFGALFGLALVTKYFSLILLPEVLLTLSLAAYKSRRTTEDLKTTAVSTRGITRVLFPFGLALLLVAGPWFAFILLRFNRISELGLIAGLAASLGEPQITEGLVGLLSGQPSRPPAATYPFPAWLSLLYRSFWFEYGWMQRFAPAWVYGLFTIFGLFAGIGLIIALIKQADFNPPPSQSPYASRFTFHVSRFPHYIFRPPTLLLLHLSLFLLVVLVRYALSATIDTGQGRHLYPALPVLALAAALGWRRLGQLGTRRQAVVPLGYLLFFLLPALVCLLPSFELSQGQFRFYPIRFISPHYRTLPVTSSPVALPVEQRLQLEFAPGLFLAGFQSEASVMAGSALPVTLFWQAEQEARQDYWLSLCLEAEPDQPAACWRGQIADGAYPARAWEAGDTLIDPYLIPVPACDQLTGRPYTLRLTVWPLALTSPQPLPEGPPLVDHRFEAPAITILQAANSPPDLSNQAKLWAATGPLRQPATLRLGQSLAEIDYTTAPSTRPLFTLSSNPEQVWHPLANLEAMPQLPCAGGSALMATLAHFSADPTLRSGVYQGGETLPELTLSLRDRVFAPVTTTLTFSDTLAPLSLQPPAGTLIDLSQAGEAHVLPYPLTPGASLPLTLRWQARQWMAEPLVLVLKLLDKDFMVAGERSATLGGRYPNVLWAPGEVIEESYAIPLSPEAPPGLYRLEISLIHQDQALPGGYTYLPIYQAGVPAGDNLYPLAIRLLDPAHGTPPPHPFQAELGPDMRLTGYEVNPNFSDSPATIELALYWAAAARIETDYTVFTQLIGPDGQVWAQWDNPPQAGRYPTTAWNPHDSVIDRYRLTLRENAPPGEYRLLVGMYDPVTRQRLPATIAGTPQPDNALLLTTIQVAEKK